MADKFVYFDFHNTPARILRAEDGEWGEAELYQRGEGFVSAMRTDILYDGTPISKEEFNALVLDHTRPKRG